MGTRIRFSVLLGKAKTASTKAMKGILDSALPSRWGKNAIGWQMYWKSPGAVPGMYATCDTLFLVSRAFSKDLNHPLLGSIWVRALDSHLSPQMRFARAAGRSKRAMTIAKNKATTYKQARFLQAVACSPKLTNARRRIAMQVKSHLLNQLHDGTWTDSAYSSSTSLAATAAAVKGLASMSDTEYEDISESISYIISESESQPLSFNNIIALECLTFLSKYSNSHIRSRITFQQDLTSDLMSQLLKTIAKGSSEDASKTIKFQTVTPPETDFFSFNKKLTICTCIIRLIEQRACSHMLLLYTAPVILDVIDQLNRTTVFIDEPERADPYHWETAEAILMLREFYKLAQARPEIRRLTGMIVAPRVFEDRDFPIDPKSVFVVMPLTKELKKNVLPIFKKAASETKLGLQVKTSEMDWTDGDKVKKIWEQLNSASYVVVDCTDHNPNVFYELGIAHTLGKLTYLCARNRTDLSSFDIRNIHSKAYNDFNYDSMNELKKDLKNWFLKANKEFAL